ncbi:MAG TPA: hypothetical protein VNB23_16020, partial [Ramlibacter sp.]|nr:hypothetical protein [Ramlibacter sp.]
MPQTNPLRPARRASLIPVLALLLVPAAESWSAEATKVAGDQKRAVEQYLDAVASGNPQAVAMAIHA